MLYRNESAKLALTGLLFSLLISCLIISTKRYYWNDELYSYYLISDTEFSGMLAAFNDKINNTPIVYFVVGWLWVQAFGASELSLRALSSLTMFVAACLLWFLLRRNYSNWAATFSVLCVFSLSAMIIHHNVEARMYGLFIAASALVFLLYDQICRHHSTSNGFFMTVAAGHALLLHTHLFGIFYSAAAIGAGLLVDYLRGRWQPRVYIAYLVAWLSVLAYLPTFLVQADAGNPRTWIPPPSLGDLVWFYGIQMRLSLHLLLLLAILYGLLRCYTPPLANTPRRRRLTRLVDCWAAQPTLALAVCLLLLPMAIWIISLTIKPIFLNKYMIPTLLAVAVLLAHLVDRLDACLAAASKTSGRLSGLITSLDRLYQYRKVRDVGFLILLLFPLAYAWQFPREDLLRIADLDSGDNGLPIVIQASHEFLKSVQYEPDIDRYVHLLDWETAVSTASGTFPPQEYKHMGALLRNYPERFSGRILESDPFLANNGRFLVLDYIDYNLACGTPFPWYSLRRNLDRGRDLVHCPRWLEEQILADDRYSVTLAGRLPPGEDASFVVLLVERRVD